MESGHFTNKLRMLRKAAPRRPLGVLWGQKPRALVIKTLSIPGHTWSSITSNSVPSER